MPPKRDRIFAAVGLTIAAFISLFGTLIGPGAPIAWSFTLFMFVLAALAIYRAWKTPQDKK